MNEQLELNSKNDFEFQNIIKELIENKDVQAMKNFRQHCDVSCFEHCYTVSYYCYLISKKMKLDYKSAAVGAMLHDMFLYDWRIKGTKNRWHAFTHGNIACTNASRVFNLNEKEKDMIKKHMWPVTIVPFKSREGFILTLVDKYCTIAETNKYIFKNMYKKKFFRYAYVLLGIIIFKRHI